MIINYNLITITGATASGKTSVAAHLAKELDSEIISADSRQVYRGMDIGTGKDIEDYTVEGIQIPHHLIDIVDAGYKYNVYEFQKDFFCIYKGISSRNKIPVLCGGTGMYIESVLRDYKLIQVPVNDGLRANLKNMDINELERILRSYKAIHNKSDLDTPKRAIRAIEIAEYYSRKEVDPAENPEINSLNVGIYFNREERRERITQRLSQRLKEGLVEEVEMLIKKGLTYDDLEYYGLEYKFVSWYLSGKIDYEELFNRLNTAIHQFSKRQITWFRKMEKSGIKINWIDGNLPMEKKVANILELLGGY